MIWCTVADAAKLAYVHERTLRRAIARKEIPAVEFSPRQRYVYLTSVQSWACRLTSSPPVSDRQ